MTDHALDFSFDPGNEDRAALLREAAALAAAGHLGGGLESVTRGEEPETADSALLRAMGEDRVDLAYPDVYRITDRDFLDHGRPAPVRLAQMTRDFDFHWIRFPVGLFAAPGWRFDRLEMAVAFSAAGGDEVQPKAYQILPNRDFQQLIDADTRFEVGIDEGFQFAAHASPKVEVGLAGATASAKADVNGATGAKLVAGPFHYRIRRARIDHSDTGLGRVFWRIDGDECLEEGAPAIVVVAQLPKRAGRPVKVEVAVQASRFFSYARASLKDVIAGLPDRIRRFFQGGAPVRATASYDLTPRL